MRSYKSMEHATRGLAVDYDQKVSHMLISASKNDIFKNPILEKNYSFQWLKHHIYTNPKINVFKKLLLVFPPKYSFKIEGYDEIFASPSE